MKTFFANNWRPHSGFLGAKISAAVPVGVPMSVQFAPPTTFIYPPPGYVYPNGFQQVYEVSTPPPAPSSSAMPWVIGAAALAGVAALIAVASRGR